MNDTWTPGRKSCRGLLALAMLSLLCPSTAWAQATPDTKAAEHASSFQGLVDIGDGRKIFAEWRGEGGPTVVFIAGKGGSANDWSQVLDPRDPAQDSLADDVGAGLGKLYNSDDAVFPSVARFSRVLVYDRPGVRFEGPDISTPVPQPHTVDQAVADLQALLVASQLPGPYVLVCHSYGGYIAALYARLYPDSVAGLVMVDAATELMEEAVGLEKFVHWDAGHRVSSEGGEAILVMDASQQIRAAEPFPRVPTVVLSSDRWIRLDLMPPEIVGDEKFLTFTDWQAGQEILADSLGGDHIRMTNSGHFLFLNSPALVIQAIHKVVTQVRRQPGEHDTRTIPLL